jgi:low affinity Fe/Cu permease
MDTSALLSQIDAEISRLQEARNLLAGRDSPTHQTVRGIRKKRFMSAEAREKIAAAQRKRWAKQKKAAK